MRRLPLPTLVFFATLFGLPLVQAGLELSRGEHVQVLDVIGPLEAPRLRAFERELLDASCLHERAVPAYQAALLGLLRRGNEQAIASAPGWLDYTPDVDHVTGPGVLAVGATGRVAARTLVRFRDVLAASGVELLLIPVPTKTSVEPRFLSRDAASPRADNPDTELFLSRLTDAGLHVLDLPALYAGARTGDAPLYLPLDTHWTPSTMRTVARAAAERASALCEFPRASGEPCSTRELRVSGPGDLVEMLDLPPDSAAFAPLALELEQVRTADDRLWAPTPGADVLLLGDSFTRVFSDPTLGLGAGAGLAEHISLALGRPLDVIALAGGGAAGVRAALARRPAGLAGKRLVIWEFTLRELSAGVESWRWIELPDRPGAEPVSELSPELPRTLTVELVEVSVVDPDFDYAFCLGVFEYLVLEGEHEGPLWVAHPLLVDHRPTAAAGYAPGLRQRLVLEPIEDHHDLESTSWIDDTDAGFDIFFAVESSPLD